MRKTEPNASIVENSTTAFLKSLNSQDHLFWAWRHAHSKPFPVWGLLWQMMIVHAGVRLRHLTMHLDKETQVVQSLTEINNKI